MRDAEGVNRATATDLLLVILFSAVIFGYVHLQTFTNPFIINDDVRQQIYWMQQWQDPALISGRLSHRLCKGLRPLGRKGDLLAGSLGLNPLDFSKLLPGGLFVFLAICLFRIGVNPRTAAWVGWWWPSSG